MTGDHSLNSTVDEDIDKWACAERDSTAPYLLPFHPALYYFYKKTKLRCREEMGKDKVRMTHNGFVGAVRLDMTACDTLAPVCLLRYTRCCGTLCCTPQHGVFGFKANVSKSRMWARWSGSPGRAGMGACPWWASRATPCTWEPCKCPCEAWAESWLLVMPR